MTSTAESEATRKTRQLNDLFRQTMLSPFGRVLLTYAVQKLPQRSLSELLSKVRAYDNFDPGDDPYRHHDFGAVDHDGQRWLWKIDYFARGSDFREASRDPSNTHDTERVLTIMHADEY